MGRSITVSFRDLHKKLSPNQWNFITAGIKPQVVGNDTMVQVPCECGHSTARRYPARYCGPRRQACHRQSDGKVEPGDTFEGIWVDGFNTFVEEKSDHPRKPK